MSKQSTASRLTIFVIILIAIAGFTAIAAQHQMLPSLLPKSALLGPHGAHRGAPSGDQITQAIDEKAMVPMTGNTRPEANPKNDLGRVSDALPMEHMHLVLQRAPEKEQELKQLIDELHDRNSANFHQWLTADEFGQRFGVAQEDIGVITGWLESHGFYVNQVYASHMLIDFSGSAGEVREAFHTEIHNLMVNGKPHIANMSDPQIPAALAPVIKGIASLNDFKPHPMYKSKTQYTFSGCATSTGSPTEPGTCYAMTPQDNAVIYNTNPLWSAGISGQGQTIALVEDTDTYGTAGSNGASDWNTYRSTFGLSGYSGTYTQLHPGGCTDPGTNADDGEAAIDVEMASAFAPSANIELISCSGGATTFGGQIALQNLINGSAPYPGVVSVSYGVCEAFNGNGGNQAFYNTYQQAAAQGISVFVSSGDDGPSECSANFNTPGYQVASLGVTGWGETPYNVSVGGTDFEDTYNSKEGGAPLSTYWSATNTSSFGSALSYVPEIPWNDACANVLISKVATGSFVPYGASPATCNNATFDTTTTYLSTGAASGGASNCATGAGGTDQGADGISFPGCQGYAKPSWQSAYGVPNDGLRDTPDVSMFAANGVWGHFETVCWSDPSQTANGSVSCAGAPSGWSGFGGTSVAAPSMAAIQALVNQRTAQTWGNVNTKYYQIAQNEYGTQGGTFLGGNCNSSGSGGPASGCVFNDVTQGDIDLACEDNGTLEEAHCYKPTGTHGVDSTDVITAATVIYGGTGYTQAPGCAIAGPTNNQAYLSPTGTTLWAGGTQATCTAAVNSGTNTAKWTVVMNSTSGVGDTIILTNPSGSTTCGPYTLSGTTTTLMASNLVTAIGSACSLASATSSTKTVTITAKTAGAAGNFITEFGTATLFDAFYVYITNTVLGEGPNYVSVITINTGGSGYQPEAPITLTGGGGTGAVAVANTSISTAASTYQATYGAAPGYDMATGLGTVNAYNLVNAFLTPQSITFTTPAPSSAANGSNFGVAATASSGLTVAFTASGVCTVVDNLNGTATYTMTSSSGTCNVIANQAGNNTYAAAPTVTETVTATSAQQTGSIVWLINAPSPVAYNTNFTVEASADNNTVTPSFTAGGVCSVVDHGNGFATYTMTSGTGTCTVTANAAANSGYTAATASETTNASLATPTATFTGAPGSATYGTQFGVNSSTNASTLASITSDGVACSGSGTGSATITMISGTGTCTTTANWAADSNYSAATMSQTTTAQPATPTTTFTGAPTSAVYNSTFTVTATTNDMGGPGKHRPQSENPAAITASGACSVPANSQNSALVTMTSGTGACSLTATWQADNDYTGATANQSSTAQLATPTVSFIGAPSSAAYGSSFGVTSSTNSSTVAAISGDNTTCSGGGTAAATITMISGSGTCSMMAVWAADNNYSGATATQSTTATLASTSTALTAVNYSLNPGQSTTLTATVTFSGATAPTGNVTFYLNGQALIPTGSLAPATSTTATATYTLKASQLNAGPNSLYASYAGDGNYGGSDSSASPITITLGTNNLSFGQVNVGTTATGMTVTYNFTANETLSNVLVLTTGQPSLDFTNAGGNTCIVSNSYTAGQSCTVNVNFTPRAPGVRSGAVVLFAVGQTTPLATFYINGTGESSAATVDPGTQTTLGSITNADPGSVAVDAAGNAYMAACDESAQKGSCGEVIEIAAGTQTQTTVLSGLGGFGSVALDGAGNLYVTVTGKAQKGDLSAGVEVVPNEMGTLNANDAIVLKGKPNETTVQVSVDALGDLYILEGSGKPFVGDVEEVAASGAITTLLTGLTNATSMAVDAAGDCYIGSTSMVVNQPGAVNEYPGCSGSPTQIGSGFQDPQNLALDASGTLYVLDTGALQVYAVTPGAAQSTIPTTGLNSPAGLALDGSANLYIPDADGNGNALLYEVNRTLPLALSFPTEMIGNASAPQTVTVSNVGDGVFTTSNLVIPTNFIQVSSGGTDCSGSTGLNPGRACQMAIEFDPTGTGSDSGNVTLTDNALNNPASTQSVAVSGNGSQDSQTITFTQNAPPSAVYNTSFGVAATASSGLTVVFTASGQCTVVDNLNGTATYTMTSGTGTCTVLADQPGNSTYSAAPEVTESATAALATPTTTYTGAPATAAYGATFEVTATTNASTHAVTTSSGACSNSFRHVTMTSGTGTCNLTATWAADSNYTGATASQSTTATLATPTTTFTGAPTSAVYSSTFTVTATTNDMSGPGKHRPQSENPAAITASGACSVPANSQNTALVTMTSGTGTCSLTATWQADSDYTGATANQSTTAQLANPTTTFTGAPSSAAYGAQFDVTSTTNASTAATISSSGGACTGSGTTSATITMTSGTGTCYTQANWAADSNYNGAVMDQTTTAQLATPVVNFTGAPTSAAYNSTFTVTATTNDMSGPGKHRPQSENPAAITASGACSVPANSQNSALVTMISGMGTCSLTATWQADSDYSGATANQSTTAQLATPTTTFTGAPGSAAYNSTFTVTATTNDTGNNAAITAGGSCSVPANSQNSALVTMTSGTGACNLTATWAADGNYSGATKNQSTNAQLATPTTTFTGAPNSAAFGSTFTVSATTNDTGNNAAITAGGSCSVPANSQNSALVTMTSGTGTCSLTATWSADSNYSGATRNQSTNAQLATPTTTFTGAPNSAAYGSTFTVTATTNDTGNNAAITAGGSCSVPANSQNTALVTMTSGTGTCNLTATWSADSDYSGSTKNQSTTAQLVTPTTTFTGAPPSAAYGSTFTVTATTNDTGNNAAITAGGSCSVPANSQNTALVTMTSGTGTCSLTATWSADSDYSGATKSQSTSAIKATPSTTFTGAPASAVYKTSFTANATTNASTSATISVSGVCSITSGGTNSATVQMTSGTGSCSLTATWAADNNYNSATASQSTAAAKAATHTAFSTSPNPSTKGQAVTLSATVAGPGGDGIPTGTITFQPVSGSKMKVEPVSPSGGASFSIALPVGSHRLEAIYSGDSNFAGNTSNKVVQVVNP